MFTAALSTTAKKWKQPKCPSTCGLKKCDTYTHTPHTHTHTGIWCSYEKEGNSAIYNMDGPPGHDAKWNKSDRERQTLYDPTYMWNLNKAKLIGIA